MIGMALNNLLFNTSKTPKVGQTKLWIIFKLLHLKIIQTITCKTFMDLKNPLIIHNQIPTNKIPNTVLQLHPRKRCNNWLGTRKTLCTKNKWLICMQDKIIIFYKVQNKSNVMVCNRIVVKICNKVIISILNFNPKVNNKW